VTIGEVVKRERIKKGISYRGLAKKADVALATIQNIESGKHVPTNSTLKSIAEALDMKSSDILLETVADLVKQNDANGKRGW
jgi:transcriptional regulator with XRE-family HTH domain